MTTQHWWANALQDLVTAYLAYSWARCSGHTWWYPYAVLCAIVGIIKTGGWVYDVVKAARRGWADG